VIFVDTNVFVIALRYPRDRHTRARTLRSCAHWPLAGTV